MRLASIVELINFIVFILKILFEYGPKLYGVGVDIYNAVEGWADGKQETGFKITSADKANKFDASAKDILATRKKSVTPDKYRQDIWLSRRDNWTKKNKAERTNGG